MGSSEEFVQTETTGLRSHVEHVARRTKTVTQRITEKVFSEFVQLVNNVSHDTPRIELCFVRTTGGAERQIQVGN